jgi:hypothetical protein
VAYTTVITAQTTALSDEESALSIRQTRLTDSVALIEALGGGWDTTQLPSRDSLRDTSIFWTLTEQRRVGFSPPTQVSDPEVTTGERP